MSQNCLDNTLHVENLCNTQDKGEISQNPAFIKKIPKGKSLPFKHPFLDNHKTKKIETDF